jgi:flavorubredoxin
VISTRAGYNFLRAITNLDFKSRIVKDGEMLNLGGLTLKFIVAPNLHWPDSMFTYIEENSYLFSCDFLGAHCTVPKMFDKYVKDETNYNRAFKYYYDAIFGPFKKFVLNGLEKIKDLKLSAVLPSHGPILIEKIGENIEKYRKWSQIDNEKLAKNATIVYVSAYGCTEKLAKIAEKTLKDDSLNANIYNAIRSDPAEISASIASSKFLLFGSPTINSDALKPIWDVVSTIDAFSAKSKFSAVFGSYGWTGEAVPALCERLRTLKFHVFEDGFKVNFVPSREDIENMQKFVERFIESAK